MRRIYTQSFFELLNKETSINRHFLLLKRKYLPSNLFVTKVNFLGDFAALDSKKPSKECLMTKNANSWLLNWNKLQKNHLDWNYTMPINLA